MTEVHHEDEVEPNFLTGEGVVGGEVRQQTYFATCSSEAHSDIEVTRHVDGSWRLRVGNAALEVATAEDLDSLAFLMGYSRAR